MNRFHLAGWSLGAWALFQPMPSMYNFENRWAVVFPTATRAECHNLLRGFVNHHVFNRILLQRAQIENCGLPADVLYQSTYRGSTVETRYRITHGPGSHGLVVTPVPGSW